MNRIILLVLCLIAVACSSVKEQTINPQYPNTQYPTYTYYVPTTSYAPITNPVEDRVRVMGEMIKNNEGMIRDVGIEWLEGNGWSNIKGTNKWYPGGCSKEECAVSFSEAMMKELNRIFEER